MTSSRFILASAMRAQAEITEQTEKTEHTETAKAHPCVPFFPSVNHRNGQKIGMTRRVTIITQMVRIPPTRT
jgi:hypothetical protein